MNSIINQNKSEKYTWGDGCFGWYFLNTKKLSIIQEEMGPGKSEAPHFHIFAQQYFYILQGKATIFKDGKPHQLHKGDGIHIPPKSIHSIINNSNQKLDFLVISSPHSHSDKIPIDNKKSVTH